MRLLPFSLLLCGVLVLPGCRNHVANRADAAMPANAGNPAYDDAARFLAGLPGRAESSFRPLEAQPSWQQYHQGFEELWKQVEQTQLQPVARFQEQELRGVVSRGVLFYPFSGPDVLYATAFFPQAKHIIMAGLEPAGSIRPASLYTAESLPHELNAWNNALYSIFKRSFFVTGEMSRHFRGRVADGIAPTMLLLLARTGHTIDDVHYVHLDEQGRLVQEADSPLAATASTSHPGVEIIFHRGQETERRTVDYFSTDLGPGWITKPAFATYVANQGRVTTFVKSASFLLHWRMCDPLREFILQQSDVLVQDDTGVPFGYLKSAAWDVRLYGQYSRPDRPFHKHYQKDLASEFSEGARVKPLGFSVGYGYGRRPSSLIVARRKAS